jgi:hypothetical protein
LVTDLAAEESFQMAGERMKEHHGVEVNVSAVRKIAERHASRASALLAEFPPARKSSRQMTMEMDGEMVPLVEYESSKDRRKTKKNLWAELRIGVVQNHEEVTWKYATSFKTPDHLGDRMLAIMKKMGLDEKTKVHGVGDGALWIPEQGERVAGAQYTHLIDLFHLCEYLGEAVTGWTEDVKQEVKRLKTVFENGGWVKAQKELKRRQKKSPGHKGLEDCIRYIENRPGQFEYKAAMEKGLPVGSGKVESSHRSLIQKRLKKPGTWWLRENAEKMADLRTVRANGCWELLWQEEYRTKPNLQAA